MKELGKLRTQQGWCNTHCLYTSSYTKQSGESSYSHIQLYRPFPTNPPPAKEESAGEKVIFFFKEKERKERKETGLWETGALEVQEQRVRK